MVSTAVPLPCEVLGVGRSLKPNMAAFRSVPLLLSPPPPQLRIANILNVSPNTMNPKPTLLKICICIAPFLLVVLVLSLALPGSKERCRSLTREEQQSSALRHPTDQERL